MVDEDVVGRDVDESLQHAALREVDLLAVARRERLVEHADEVERLAPDVAAVADHRGDPRAQALRCGRDGPRHAVDVRTRRQAGHRLVARRERDDRPVIRERRRARDVRCRVGGGAQALEPFRADLAVAVQDHDVARRGERRRRRSRCRRSRGSVPDGGSGRRAPGRARPASLLEVELDLGSGARVVGDEDRHVRRRVREHALAGSGRTARPGRRRGCTRPGVSRATAIRSPGASRLSASARGGADSAPGRRGSVLKARARTTGTRRSRRRARRSPASSRSRSASRGRSAARRCRGRG